MTESNVVEMIEVVLDCLRHTTATRKGDALFEIQGY